MQGNLMASDLSPSYRQGGQPASAVRFKAVFPMPRTTPTRHTDSRYSHRQHSGKRPRVLAPSLPLLAVWPGVSHCPSLGLGYFPAKWEDQSEWTPSPSSSSESPVILTDVRISSPNSDILNQIISVLGVTISVCATRALLSWPQAGAASQKPTATSPVFRLSKLPPCNLNLIDDN